MSYKNTNKYKENNKVKIKTNNPMNDMKPNYFAIIGSIIVNGLVLSLISFIVYQYNPGPEYVAMIGFVLLAILYLDNAYRFFTKFYVMKTNMFLLTSILTYLGFSFIINQIINSR